jgi:heavy metal sensor kinase
VQHITRFFGVRKLRVHFVRGLRFRLALSYTLFFAVLLILIGVFFRTKFENEITHDDRALLEEQWGAAKGYLRFEHQRPFWAADSTDPEEAYIVERLRHVYLLTDSNGNVLQSSVTYDSIAAYSPEEILRIVKSNTPDFRIRYDTDRNAYLLKAAAIPDDKGRLYFFAIGRSLDNLRTASLVTRLYFTWVPVLLAAAALLGWAIAGRALLPLNSVAQTAQRITGSDLSHQIPLRGAGDELDHLIDSFNRMTVRLNHSFEQIRRFSTDVSHELRTPLTAIRGQLEVALFTAETPEQYRDAMVNALEDVEKLSSIVRALLLLSQAESGQVVLQKTDLDLTAMVEDIVEQFQIPAEEKNLSLSPTLEPRVIVNADRIQIERMLSNLLSNAVKYTPPGGAIRVALATDTQHAGWCRLEVSDTGMGIPEENLPHIFDRFYRVRGPETNPIQGLGLGLSFVAWIVEAHAGRIEVVSTPGQGTRFTVSLPAVVPAAGSGAAESSEAPGHLTQLDLH